MKHGDTVIYVKESRELTAHGFELGNTYMVKKDGLGLFVRPNDEKYGVSLVLGNGDLTENVSYFQLQKPKNDCYAWSETLGCRMENFDSKCECKGMK